MGKIKLYHFSNRDFKGYILPKFFGDNSYTSNDKKYDIPRVFFYLKDEPIEKRFKYSQYKYIAEIDKHLLYDLREDKGKLLQKFRINDTVNINDLLTYLKQNYQGAIYNVGFDIAILFYPIEYKAKENLR